MGHIDVNNVSYALPDGRPLLDGVTFTINAGDRAALLGPNGVGKSTLFRIMMGDEIPADGVVNISGSVGLMRQFIGQERPGETPLSVRGLLATTAAPRAQAAVIALEAAELAVMTDDTETHQMAYAQALVDYAEAGCYELETFWDKCCTTALHASFDRVADREASTLSGGEQKRLVLTALFEGPAEVLILDEPDNYLDVPAKLWLESALQTTKKTVLLISHDRELLAQSVTKVVTLEPGRQGATAWIHGGGFASWQTAREARFDRLDELRRRWDEDHTKLKELVLMYKLKAKFNDSMASRYRAAQTRLERFEAIGPPLERPQTQRVSMRLTGGRTGRRAVMCESLELTGLMKPFDAEIWYGDRVAVLGSNGSGKSHFLRLLAVGGSDPAPEHQPVAGQVIAAVNHTGTARLGARVRPGWFAQTHHRPDLAGRELVDILHRGDDHRDGMGREAAGRALDRYVLAESAHTCFDVLSGGQQARFQILLLELSGATLLLLDEPTDNLDIESAEALELGLAGFEGTVIAVTHDRWFARSFDQFLVFRSSGEVTASTEPVWDEAAVERRR